MEPAGKEGFKLRYKVDLKTFMAECEANYFRLCRLLPESDVTDHFRLKMPGRGEMLFHLKIQERTAYTLLLEIYQQQEPVDPEWLQMPTLKVRIYHDAKLAEVVAFEGVRKVKPRNQYPNYRMHQPDEKAQWNRFLADWLKMAIRHGYSASVPCEFGAL